MTPMTYSRRRTSSGRKSRIPRAGSVRAINAGWSGPGGASLHPREREPQLPLILALLVGVRDLARLVALEEQDLGDPFVGVHLGRQRRGVRDLERDEALPLGLERGDVHDQAAARVGGLANAHRQHVAR